MPKKQEYWPGYLSDRIYFIFNDKFPELGLETVVLIVKGTAVFYICIYSVDGMFHSISLTKFF